MGMLDKFSFGKKELPPFKIPREVQELRARIETENKENFPSLTRYKDIMRDAERVFQFLGSMIAKNNYAGEAARIQEEIRDKLEVLGDKIKRNMQDARKDTKEDYVERNIDYLERKSYRNKAKTLFTAFLENFVSFERYCREGSMEPGKKIELVITEMSQAVADLQQGFFTNYVQDREIQAIKEDMLDKVAIIRILYAQSKQRFREAGVQSSIESKLQVMSKAREQSS